MLYISGKFTENQLEKQWEFSRDYSITSHRWLHHHQKNRRRQIRRIHRLRKNLLQRSHRRHRIRQGRIYHLGIYCALCGKCNIVVVISSATTFTALVHDNNNNDNDENKNKERRRITSFSSGAFLGFKFP